MSCVSSADGCRHKSYRGAISPPFLPVRTDDPQALLSGGGDSPQDVRAPAGGRDRDQHVSRPAETAHLPLEDALVAPVVSKSGQHRAVGRQRDSRKRRALVVEPAAQLAPDVLRIGRCRRCPRGGACRRRAAPPRGVRQCRRSCSKRWASSAYGAPAPTPERRYSSRHWYSAR